MGRTGLHKTDVEKARNSIIAQGRHPSVDAVRIALGNTGSKTTISKYLRELEAESGGPVDRKTSISAALQNLVGQLAEQLEIEASSRIADISMESSEKDRLHAEEIDEINAKHTQIKEKLDLTIAAIKQEIESHEQTKEALQSETMAHHTLAQQVIDLKERLVENDVHRQSLEEKHQHAREALEHYRNSVKEQREQEIRSHEQQVQQLQADLRQLQQALVTKQNEITRLNQDGARWVAEISQAKKTIYDEQASHRKLSDQVDALRIVEQRAKALEPQLAEKDSKIRELEALIHQHAETVNSQKEQLHRMEIDQASAMTKIEAQQNMMAELKSVLAGRLT
ncbi:DNA-binding protein [Undibacterium sp. CY18W]|uniref:DNA-binding protein n=1 Tax=Undibacterium hunanense TaxID=2762292 RepID=A0ABR6ZMH5_9BURK|nr:DNA-binding protein [Undibacterium hunanense]MBC3917087.1 DNA-binding protein [Undibacterium hunanense]